MNGWIGAHGKTVMVIVEEADWIKIEMPAKDSGERPEGRVLTKTVDGANGMMIVFQYWPRQEPVIV
ncbi:MAG: hypothetical protein JWQ90_2562 [Hydrocarboniphaga sp.]|uniref:hypothetical protein n=1 Tax=Hydrocarboniphaga sp. TaxID=2033016 RepID=UPI0026364FEC|nr:hypothetical protein [Hydrocarboniphaga sp.]MDB5970112.1 hypothetical protein [Hydrocarboniphaga sp.]